MLGRHRGRGLVTIELNGSTDDPPVLGSRDIVAGTDYDIMTPDSPIGKAIEGAKVGDVVSTPHRTTQMSRRSRPQAAGLS